MQNLDTSQMDSQVPAIKVKVRPTLIPITPALLADQTISTYYYRVAPSDVLAISVWEHPEFNILGQSTATNANGPGIQGAAGQQGFLVNSNGAVYFPLIQYVHVAGLTVDEVRAVITARLRKYIPNPQVYVRVVDYRGQKIYVQGEVVKPGFVPITDQPLTIADALTLTGSMDPNTSDPRHIYIIRGDILAPKIYWLNANTADALLLAERFSLQPRDILYVSTATAANWNRIINQLLPTLQAFWFTKSITTNNN